MIKLTAEELEVIADALWTELVSLQGASAITRRLVLVSRLYHHTVYELSRIQAPKIGR